MVKDAQPATPGVSLDQSTRFFPAHMHPKAKKPLISFHQKFF
jgi:hypothetical protein